MVKTVRKTNSCPCRIKLKTSINCLKDSNFWFWIKIVLLLHWLPTRVCFTFFGSVSWGCGKHQLNLCRGLKLSQQMSCYDMKQSDGEVLVTLELWGMSTPLLTSLPGAVWPRVVASDRVLSMGQIELNCVLMLNLIVWNRIVLTFNCA